jgi:transcription-repair coupling factor (superfamily II helicase)
VHKAYGIGRFAGLHHLDLNAAANDFILVEYSGRDKLYVPVDRLGLLQRFKGAEGVEPPLDRLGGSGWAAGREKARKAIETIAADLVEMYAYRKVTKGFRYDPPGDLYHEFEATFGFEETPDQARAIQEVLEDMDQPRPMDRLVCGDVGFGKTEVALRAAFRAAAEGRQVALLCPTTVLAEQHYQTFRARLAGFPVNVGLLSRFVPRPRQKEVLRAAAAGQIDILIGTHRILSSDVQLPNLTLLILDEEQRFGVRHKEKLKALKKNVDVLTLTATPIPRTLQLSMSGIRELSID